MNDKINHENKILLKKILKINNKPSLYHPINLQMKTCPAFEKSGYKNYRKQLNILFENQVLINLYRNIKKELVVPNLIILLIKQKMNINTISTLIT